jgi:uncharacterized membrane protein YkvI
MYSIRSFENRLIVEILGVVFLAAGLSFLLAREEISLGIIIGGLGSIINFKLILKDAKTKINFLGKKSQLFFSVRYLIRYAIMAVVLLIASFKGIECLIGAGLGLLCLRLSIFVDTFFVERKGESYSKKIWKTR